MFAVFSNAIKLRDAQSSDDTDLINVPQNGICFIMSSSCVYSLSRYIFIFCCYIYLPILRVIAPHCLALSMYSLCSPRYIYLLSLCFLPPHLSPSLPCAQYHVALALCSRSFATITVSFLVLYLSPPLSLFFFAYLLIYQLNLSMYPSVLSSFTTNHYLFDDTNLIVSPFQSSFYSMAMKSLISVSTLVLLGLILAYHTLEVQVSDATIMSCHVGVRPSFQSFDDYFKIGWPCGSEEG